MGMFAGKTELQFEQKMPVALDATGETVTPENMRPTLGALAALAYRPTTWRYLIRLSGAPSAGVATVTLYAGNVAVRTEDIELTGVQQFSNNVPVYLDSVQGEMPLAVAVDVTTAADAGITATIDSVVTVEQPLTIAGC